MPMHRRTRWTRAALVVLAVTISSHPAGASDRPPNDLPVAPLLLAPVPCGVEVQGTTYGGHGRHNWALDLNTTAGPKREDVGLPILAQADGTVVWFKTSGYNKGAGTYIEIDYGDVTARYIHLVEGSIPDRFAEIGAVVETGDQLGELGGTGRVSAPHLHLEYWDSADHVDTAWYQLPRANQIPVYFESVEMVATVGSPSRTVSSTNCAEPTVDEILRELRERRLTQEPIRGR
ncbi:MAG: hypothetical protein DHS20C19_03400 [Acidimicrobiales bacterium]|nr:MAG: hypothetical protein DHS20C19_03400 [Acidimicrobiales bacterium]